MHKTKPTQFQCMDLCWMGVKGGKVDSESENTEFTGHLLIDFCVSPCARSQGGHSCPFFQTQYSRVQQSLFLKQN